jgi:hypothetical protein
MVLLFQSVGAAGLASVIELGKGTAGKCGKCRGCKRDVCRECSACKRGEFGACIDTYCSEEEAGRASRASMKELYLRYNAHENSSLTPPGPTILTLFQIFGRVCQESQE